MPKAPKITGLLSNFLLPYNKRDDLNEPAPGQPSEEG